MVSIGISALIIWFFAHLLSPVGTQFSLGRSFATVVSFAVITLLIRYFGSPVMGPLWIPISGLISVLIIRSMLGMPYGRAAALFSIYIVLITVLQVAVARYMTRYDVPPKKPVPAVKTVE